MTTMNGSYESQPKISWVHIYESEIVFGICFCFQNISREFLLFLGSHNKAGPFIDYGTELNENNTIKKFQK